MSADKQDLVSEWTDLVNDIQSKVEWSCEKELTVIKMLGFYFYDLSNIELCL